MASMPSPSAQPGVRPVSARVLICGVNWLGDAVMSLPAVAAFLAERPEARVSMLAKPPLVPFWRMVAGLDAVLELPPGKAGTLRAVGVVRGGRFDRAIVMPNSFRSALIPFLARVPVRRGARSRARGLLLTERVASGDASPDRRHQAWEYMRLLPVARPPSDLVLPRLVPDAAVAGACRVRLGWDPEAAWVGLLPGAARGPSKRWPPDRFAEVGRRLAAERGGRIAGFGSLGEAGVCAAVANGVGTAALNLAGRTALPELAGLLAGCRAVVSNDSGGMHLAAAAGTPVVAVFGVTDPEVTGPIGRAHRVVAAPGFVRSRAIPRQSREAERALQAVTVEDVYAAALAALDGAASGG